MIESFNGLRAFGAIMIVLLHAKLYFRYDFLKMIPSEFLVSSVTFFFVLSGFNIYLHYRYKIKKIKLKNFLAKRFLKLYPAHIVVLILVMVFLPKGWQTFSGIGIFDYYIILITNVLCLHSLPPFIAYNFSFNSVSWFISTQLFVFIVFFYLAKKGKETSPLAILMPILFIVLVANVQRMLSVSVVAASPFEFDMLATEYINPVFRYTDFMGGRDCV